MFVEPEFFYLNGSFPDSKAHKAWNLSVNITTSTSNMRHLLTGKRAFIAGVADDNGYGWAIAKSLAAAGAEILVGTWVPVCI